MDDGPGQVDQTVARERVLGQPRLQRGIAEQPAPRVHQKLGRAPQQEAQVRGAALEDIVENSQDLFVVDVPRPAVGELVEVHHLVEHDHEPAVAGLAHERREELQVIVNAGVIDESPYAERLPGVGTRREFRPQPAQGVRLELVVAFLVPFPVAGHDRREVITADVLLQVREPRPDDGMDIAAFPGFPNRERHEPLDDAR